MFSHSTIGKNILADPGVVVAAADDASFQRTSRRRAGRLGADTDGVRSNKCLERNSTDESRRKRANQVSRK